MNYFTPERLVRLQDHSNEQQFLAALDDWEQAVESYRQQLNAIGQRLHTIQTRIPAFLKFFSTGSLHDARILDMYCKGRSRFRITLHPESSPGRLVILTYSMVEAPWIKPNVLPEQLRSEPIAWLYDELALESPINKGELVFRHAILLSDGNEIRLHFRSLALERPIPLVPAVSADPGCP
jgi:hypothetical protein